MLLTAPKRARVLPSLLILLLLNGLSAVYDNMGDCELTIGVHLTLLVLTMLTVHSLPCVKEENREDKQERIGDAINWLTEFEWITKPCCRVS